MLHFLVPWCIKMKILWSQGMIYWCMSLKNVALGLDSGIVGHKPSSDAFPLSQEIELTQLEPMGYEERRDNSQRKIKLQRSNTKNWCCVTGQAKIPVTHDQWLCQVSGVHALWFQDCFLFLKINEDPKGLLLMWVASVNIWHCRNLNWVVF